MADHGAIRGRTATCQSLFSLCLSKPLLPKLDWFENRQGGCNLCAASLNATSHGSQSSLGCGGHGKK
jgi:hypothetical protein